MNCYTVTEKLCEFFDGGLPVEEMREVETHLERCLECTRELRYLQQIDILMQEDLYPPPDEDYWSNTPKVIMRRLDLRSKASISERFFYVLSSLMPPARLRWAVVGVLAIFLMLFLSRVLYLPKSKTTLATKSTVAETRKDRGEFAKNSAGTGKKSTAEIAGDSNVKVNKRAKAKAPAASTSKTSIAFSKDVKVATERSNFTGPVNKLTPHALEQGNLAKLQFDQELIPLPAAEFLVASTLSETDTPSQKPLVQSFAEDRNARQMQPTSKSGSSEASGEKTESSFAETMWIVQQSSRLSEKKNIWLSYINRETDATYRSMGIYNLALIFAKIAEESKDPDKAKDALEFFKENEQSLRFQMGDSRYELKISTFNMLIEPN